MPWLLLRPSRRKPWRCLAPGANSASHSALRLACAWAGGAGSRAGGHCPAGFASGSARAWRAGRGICQRRCPPTSVETARRSARPLPRMPGNRHATRCRNLLYFRNPPDLYPVPAAIGATHADGNPRTSGSPIRKLPTKLASVWHWFLPVHS